MKAKQETHPADLVAIVFEKTGRRDLCLKLAESLKMPFRYCGSCESLIPMDERDTSCTFCGRQVKDPVEELRDMCEVHRFTDGPVKELWVHQSGGNVYISYLIMRDDDVLAISDDCLVWYKSMEDCLKSEDGTDVPQKQMDFDWG